MGQFAGPAMILGAGAVESYSIARQARAARQGLKAEAMLTERQRIEDERNAAFAVREEQSRAAGVEGAQRAFAAAGGVAFEGSILDMASASAGRAAKAINDIQRASQITSYLATTSNLKRAYDRRIILSQAKAAITATMLKAGGAAMGKPAAPQQQVVGGSQPTPLNTRNFDGSYVASSGGGRAPGSGVPGAVAPAYEAGRNVITGERVPVRGTSSYRSSGRNY